MAQKSPTLDLSPLMSTIDPRSELRANTGATRAVMETRRSILEQQLAQLSGELRAVNDTIKACMTMEDTLTVSIAEASTVALEHQL